jgi:uncharacterized membrane protein
MRSWLAIILVSMLAAVGACTSRTTPLPPPSVSTVSRPNDVGQVTVLGQALSGASIGVINERTLEGVITTPDAKACPSTCEFKAMLAAEGGDTLRVWQFFETEGVHEVNVPEP